MNSADKKAENESSGVVLTVFGYGLPEPHQEVTAE